MTTELRTEMRSGPYGRRNWCLIHETWWKLCPCPGQFRMTIEVPATVAAPEPSDSVTHLAKRPQ